MSAERLDPHLFKFHVHLERCPQCRGPDRSLCAEGIHLLFQAAQSGEVDLATPIPPPAEIESHPVPFQLLSDL